MNLSKIKSVLSELELKPSKGRGQNFLFEPEGIDKVISFAELSSTETCLEIGPGLGVLSHQLKQFAQHYSFVEVEPKFAARLAVELEMDFSDALVADVRELELKPPKKVVVSNVPYSVSSEIVLWCIKNFSNISRACLLLQKEFAERIAAEPGERACGSLSVLRAVFASARLGGELAGDNFFPKANVQSRLLELKFYEQPLYPGLDQELFEKVVRASFSHRRKTICNSLLSSRLLNLEKEGVARILEASEIEPSARAESIKLDKFVKLSKQINLKKGP